MTESHFWENPRLSAGKSDRSQRARLECSVRSQAAPAKAIFRTCAKTTAAPARAACRRIPMKIYERSKSAPNGRGVLMQAPGSSVAGCLHLRQDYCLNRSARVGPWSNDRAASLGPDCCLALRVYARSVAR